MAFSKPVLLAVFAVLLISVEVSAHRYVAQTTTTPTTYVRGGHPRVVIGGNHGGRPEKCNRPFSRECNTGSNGGSERHNRGSNGGRGEYNRSNGRIPNCEKNPYSRECYKGGNEGKGGNGEKRGRGPPGPETEN